MPAKNPWDDEYLRKGIPSSIRDDPSGVVVWAVANLGFMSKKPLQRAVDIGCGTGRNALYVAEHAIDVLAIDSSVVAIEAAQRRPNPPGFGAGEVTFRHADLRDGIPADTASIDLVTDVFVYKHQLASSVRRAYRHEIARVLQSGGVLLLSLAHRDDGYYSACPDAKPPEPGNPRTITDPVAQVGSVLFDVEELRAEMSDTFQLEMMWHKTKLGEMHGREYLRQTVATIWRPKPSVDLTTPN